MQEKTKNEGLLSFITTVLKKSADLPSDVSILAASVKILSERLQTIASSVAILAKSVQEHNAAIDELYSMQAFVLQQLKSQQGVDSKLPTLNKTKSDKPN